MHFEISWKRVLMSVIGVLVCGLSVGIFKRAELGVDPFQSLMSGLNVVIPINFGTLYVIANVLLLIFALIFDRKKIGIATVINLFLIGYVADFSLNILTRIIPEASLLGRYVLLLAGVVLMCLSSAFYFTANLGVSTYDAVALVISERQSKVKFRYCRIMTDLVCVLIGAGLCLLGGYSISKVFTVVGVGTIITAFFMGPLIEFFNVHVARPFLEGKKRSS
ncbi:MAG: hypothetical protein IJ106_09350 [Parasporobacterium sp.]|nr:hypothetical protein [Parasporobacterium sp.]